VSWFLGVYLLHVLLGLGPLPSLPNGQVLTPPLVITGLEVPFKRGFLAMLNASAGYCFRVLSSIGSIEETAAHEAGHVVIGYRRFEIPPEHATIEATNGVTGHCEWNWGQIERVRPFIPDENGVIRLKQGQLTADELRTCRDLIAVHLAGMVAAADVSGGERPDLAGQDKDIWWNLAGFADFLDRDAVIDDVLAEVRQEVAELRSLREAIAGELLTRRRMSGDQLLEVVERHG
jgi:hypothetical protein